MRKTTIQHWLAGAALALAACSQQDVPDSDGNAVSVRPIEFSGYVDRMTRVAAIDNDNITDQSLRLWGIKWVGLSANLPVFETDAENGVTTVLSHSGGESGKWDAPKLAFWERGYGYKFYAVYPSNADINTESQTLRGIPATALLGDNEPGYDYLTAEAEADGNQPPATVQLRLKHLLAKLTVHTFVNDPGAQVTLTNLTLWLPDRRRTATHSFLLNATAYDDFEHLPAATDTASLRNAGYEPFDLTAAGSVTLPHCESLLQAQNGGVNYTEEELEALDKIFTILDDDDFLRWWAEQHPEDPACYSDVLDYMRDTLFEGSEETLSAKLGMTRTEILTLICKEIWAELEVYRPQIFEFLGITAITDEDLLDVLEEFGFVYEEEYRFHKEELLRYRGGDGEFMAGAHKFGTEFLLAACGKTRLYIDATYESNGETYRFPCVGVEGIEQLNSGMHYRLYIEFDKPHEPIRFGLTTTEGWQTAPDTPTLPSMENPILSPSEYVDMGQAGLWATRNIGAQSPYHRGGYYQWGGVTDLWGGDGTYDPDKGDLPYLPKYAPWAIPDSLNTEAATTDRVAGGYTKYSANTPWRLSPVDDTATRLWGKDWRMPTHEEWNKLCDTYYYEWEWVEADPGLGATAQDKPVSGYRITAKNQSDGIDGNSIFLPCGGVRVNDKLVSSTQISSTSDEEQDIRTISQNGAYWTAGIKPNASWSDNYYEYSAVTQLIGRNFSNNSHFYQYPIQAPRHWGLMIRPVRVRPESDYNIYNDYMN